ncbi:hypothetical protein [uncultured Christiangramia sp.]|uniref:hypothetical protein n=1 Tax=uncultured Christiangramia sp. TaxID=503836 RepID=UPI002623E77B|nr:hypothetical protein [uncultured Christiangramia sp.]
MSFTNCGTQLAWRKDKPISGNCEKCALGILSLAIVFGMFTAGFQKFYNWIDFDLSTNGFLRWFYDSYYNMERKELFSKYVLETPSFLLEGIDYLAVLFEISGISFLLAGRKQWRAYLLIASIFHLMNVLILNIDFMAHIPVYSIFLLSPILYLFYENTISNIKYAKFIFLTLIILKFLYNLASYVKPDLNFKINEKNELLLSSFYWICVIGLTVFSFKKKLFSLKSKI